LASSSLDFHHHWLHFIFTLVMYKLAPQTCYAASTITWTTGARGLTVRSTKPLTASNRFDSVLQSWNSSCHEARKATGLEGASIRNTWKPSLISSWTDAASNQECCLGLTCTGVPQTEPSLSGGLPHFLQSTARLESGAGSRHWPDAGKPLQ
jgi:hypothetical protein